jgi:hypothetical protein
METYTLSNVKQLIDLNSDLTDFHAKFFVKTLNPEDQFEIAIVSQTDIDNNTNIIFVPAIGRYEGEKINTDGHYQNYFLIARAPKQTMCQIGIERRNLKAVQPEIPIPTPVEQYVKPIEKTNWIKILLISILVAICGYGVYVWFYDKDIFKSKYRANRIGFDSFQTPTLYKPSLAPSVKPNVMPSVKPNLAPSVKPNLAPSVKPSLAPSVKPSLAPIKSPVPPSVFKFKNIDLD